MRSVEVEHFLFYRLSLAERRLDDLFLCLNVLLLLAVSGCLNLVGRCSESILLDFEDLLFVKEGELVRSDLTILIGLLEEEVVARCGMVMLVSIDAFKHVVLLEV